jgi:hypothetical protein
VTAWRPIPGFEGAYSVSERGEVRSEQRVVLRRNGRFQTVHERILTPKRHRGGLQSVALARDGSYTIVYTHKLAAAVHGGPKAAAS